MSLNKFTTETTGYDLKLNIGCDTLKCNSLNIIEEITENSVPKYLSQSGTQIANWVMTNGASTTGAPTQIYDYFVSGNYLQCFDNLSLNTPSSGTSFNITFDLPDFVDSNLVGSLVLGTGKKSDGSGYMLVKHQSSTDGTLKKKTISISKSDGTAFTVSEVFIFSFQVCLNLNQFP
jgi:hypothetical protein